MQTENRRRDFERLQPAECVQYGGEADATGAVVTELDEIRFNVRQALADGEITLQDAAYVIGWAEAEEWFRKGMELR